MVIGLRFVFLTQYFDPEIGAPSVRLRGVITELVRLGHTVEVVTSLPNYPTGRIFPAYRGKFYYSETLFGAQVHRVWSYAAMGGGLRRLLNYLSFAVTCWHGLWKCRPPDYVFVESPPLFLGLVGVVVARRWRSRTIFNVADLWPDSVKEMGAMSDGIAFRALLRLEKWTYEKVDYVNSVTEGIRETLVNDKGVPDRKVLFLPNEVDTELFAPRAPDLSLKRELGLDGRRVLLYAGTMGYAQGLNIVLKTMSELATRAPTITLLLIGSGSERDSLKKAAVDLGLTNVMFVDPKPLAYIARAYSFSDAGLASLLDIPLFNGARPSKIFPVMASGKPIVYFGRGEGARLVEAAGAGVVVPPGDWGELSKAITNIMNDPGAAQTLGNAGRAFVLGNMTWGAIVDSWLASIMEARQ